MPEQVAGPEGVGHGTRYLGFSQDHMGAVFGHLGFHFLLLGNGVGAALFGLGAGDAGVGFRLIGLQASADVLADVDVGNVAIPASKVDPGTHSSGRW